MNHHGYCEVREFVLCYSWGGKQARTQWRRLPLNYLKFTHLQFLKTMQQHSFLEFIDN